MKFLKISLILSAIVLFAVACGETSKTTNSTTNSTTNTNKTANVANTNTAATPAADELASAKKIYSEKCVRCHKEDGTGGETEIDGVKIKAPNFTSDKMKSEPDAEFVEAIEKGFPEDGMPAFKGKISDDDIKNLVKLIRRDFQKK
jgi:mono/diheme cytochrome c family protein